MYSDFRSCLTDAIDIVLISEIPEEDFQDAVQAQACLMMGINPDEMLWYQSD